MILLDGTQAAARWGQSRECTFALPADKDPPLLLDLVIVAPQAINAEHIKQIDEIAGKSFNISTAGLFITETNGSVEVLKNEISNPLRDEPEIIAGDINLDCCIDSFDVICAKKALIKGDEPNKNLDVNKNGTFEVADVVMLQSYVLGKISDFS